MTAPNVKEDDPTSDPGPVFLRPLAATVVTLLTAALAATLWLFGQAQYINDYCTARAPQPREVLGGRPAYMSDPITVACEFDGYPTVYITEPGPLLLAFLLTATVIAVSATLRQLVNRARGSSWPPSAAASPRSRAPRR